ncbi:MAG: DUF1330 domain-containing protein [Bacteroidota bacterium]
MSHIQATPEAGKQFYQAFHDQGKVVMLNLLKFKAVADYSEAEHLDPGQEISGSEAYQRYMDATMPLLGKAGSRVLFWGKSNSYLIGPEAESWDMVLLVEHESVAKFMAFAQDEVYLKTAGHRTAALANSRLLPITEQAT